MCEPDSPHPPLTCATLISHRSTKCRWGTLQTPRGIPRGCVEAPLVCPPHIVPVSFGVHRHDIDGDVIVLEWLQPLHLHPDRREHSPAGRGEELPVKRRKRVEKKPNKTTTQRAWGKNIFKLDKNKEKTEIKILTRK